MISTRVDACGSALRGRLRRFARPGLAARPTVVVDSLVATALKYLNERSISMITFDTHPDRYRHWKLTFDGPIATLSMDVREDAGLSQDYKLKLNSYDLGVDIELADAIQRVRFEHPEVRTVIVSSLKDRIFCAGANIMMLRGSSHVAKVNFCKFTNETRLAIEDAGPPSRPKVPPGPHAVFARRAEPPARKPAPLLDSENHPLDLTHPNISDSLFPL